MKIREIIKLREFAYLNLFIRDILLAFIVLWLHYITHFNSKSVFLITGMLIVWVTWQFSDFLEYINYKKLASQ